MNSPYALYALTLAASHPALMFTIYTERLTTAVNHWLPGVIAATQKKPGESKSQPVKGCDENGMPLDPRHPWNTEKSPATEFSSTARTLYARGRT